MWQQLFRHEQCIASSCMEITGVHFPSPWRLNWSAEQREKELERWYDLVAASNELMMFGSLHHFFLQRITSLEIQLKERVAKHILANVAKYVVKTLKNVLVRTGSL